ncbi:hypothetical protein [Streptomyces sp. NPDC049813]|uniref:hypothetical protein n=1 Tax=Streptomyces sp. NPDC049813 TaxID=3365597 RepID=UPI0037BC0C4A
MKFLIVVLAVAAGFGVPTGVCWVLGRWARIPVGPLVVAVVAGWVAVIAGGVLYFRTDAGLFPETGPCHGMRGAVRQVVPPDSFCLHDDGELRSVNGPNGKAVFWAGAAVAIGVPVSVLVRRGWGRGRRSG